MTARRSTVPRAGKPRAAKAAHGGAREGAGRPRAEVKARDKQVRVTAFVPPEVAADVERLCRAFDISRGELLARGCSMIQASVDRQARILLRGDKS